MTIGAFSTATPPQGAVIFDSTVFQTSYPEFADVEPAVLSGLFEGATYLLNNTAATKITNAKKREYLLYLLTAHLAKLSKLDTVGRVNDATEGSVNAHIDWSTHVSESQAWYIQTKYGAMYWQLTSIYRAFRYTRPPCYVRR